MEKMWYRSPGGRIRSYRPAYETPAEVRMAAIWGGDAVGMSTACEAMAARHMGIEVWNFLYHQHGSWHFETGAEPQRGFRDSRQSGEILKKLVTEIIAGM